MKLYKYCLCVIVFAGVLYAESSQDILNTAKVGIYVQNNQNELLNGIKLDAKHKTNPEHDRTGRTVNGFFEFGDIYTLVKINDAVPTGYDLVQNYPNPFNPSTTIRFGVARPTDVKITIYNILGETVKTLVNEQVMPGLYQTEWDGTNEQGRGVAGGIYLATMTTPNGYVETIKLNKTDGGGGSRNTNIHRIGEASHLLKSVAEGTAGETYDFIATDDQNNVYQQKTNPNVTVANDTTFTMTMNEIQQQNTLEGVISGMFTNNIIQGATVTIDGKTATTDDQGKYTIQGLNAGTYNANITAPGFNTHNTYVTVADGTSVANDELTTQDNTWMSFFNDVARRYGATQRWKTPTEGGTKPTFHVLTKTYDTNVDVSQERLDLVEEIITNDLNEFTQNNFGWTDADIVYHSNATEVESYVGQDGHMVVYWEENAGPGGHGEHLDGNRIKYAAAHFNVSHLDRRVYLQELSQILGARADDDNNIFPQSAFNFNGNGHYIPQDLNLGEMLYKRPISSTSPDNDPSP